jgi:hypothetical protein
MTRVPWLLFAFLLLAAPPTGADTRPQSRVLFDQGMALLDEGETAAACEKLAASARLEPSITTRLALASCFERLGRTASAYTEYGAVAALASQAGEKEWHREMAALDRQKVLEKKLVRIAVEAPRGVEVRVDGKLIQPGAPVPIDPGEHAVVASAPGHESWTSTVTIRKEPVVRVVVPGLRKAAPPAITPVPEG